jgi:hypothetical protein
VGGCEESDSRMLGGRSQSNGDPGTKFSVVIGAPLEFCGILEGNPLSEQRASEVGMMTGDERFCETGCYIAHEPRFRTIENL